ncbi:MAG: carbon monoxide dehydrogenase subunit G [Chloroflexota bacterium]|nr:carbon monoxide dehydrogenase subunit G [Chloroflexota bacterium]
MNIEGTQTMAAPRQQVFDTLMSVDAIRSCLPGCETFEETGEGQYRAVLKAGLAGIRGTFSGTITLSDAQRPESYRLGVEGSFSGGFVRGTATISLRELGERTEVLYSGEGQVGGRLAAVGQRLIAPAARRVIGQFFKCMEHQLGA